MVDEKKKKESDGDDLVSGEEIQATVVDDGLDLEIVDEFNEDDFDEEFDDDFEEEIEGEYALEDDKYGKEFDENFGHLTDPTRVKKKAASGEAPKDSKGQPDPKKEKVEKNTAKAPAKKAVAKKAPAKKAAKKKAPRKK